MAYDPLSHPLPQGGFNYTGDDDQENDPLAHGAMRRWAAGGGASSPRAKQAEEESDTPALDTFGTDLTRKASEGQLDPVVGRASEMVRVAQILIRRKKNNPILIGEAGVGKTAIVEGLAQSIVDHRAPRRLWGKRVVALDMGGVVAGTKYRGQFEERMKALLNELKEHKEVIAFIDEIHTLIGAGSAPGGMDAANLLKPALARGEVQCIGATTTEEYRKTVEKDGALERRFQKVTVAAPTAVESLEILRGLRTRYEEHHLVRYTDEALLACVRLTDRYVSARSLPDKAIDAMDEAGAQAHLTDQPVPESLDNMEKEVARLRREKREAIRTQSFERAADLRDQLVTAGKALEYQRQEWDKHLREHPQTVTEVEVAEVVARMTGVPVERISGTERERLRGLANRLKRRVIGQDEAVDTLAKAIQLSRIGLGDPNRPIGAFMLVGPSGVGKTFVAETLAEELFGSRECLIRVDMSEYMEKFSVSRMIGSPPGYVGYDEGGQLTERVRRRPYAVVLFDEIEKAHPDVFNLLLQVMDEGRLTDGNGDTVDFRNTLLLMTSNSGSRELRDFGRGVGFAPSGASVPTSPEDNGQGDAESQRVRGVVEKNLSRQFRPEFLGRLTGIVHFRQLSRDSLMSIIDNELRPLVSRVEAMGVKLVVEQGAKEVLARKGYDDRYGARALRRALRSMIVDPLASMLLEGGDAPEGDGVRFYTAKAVGEDRIVITPT